MSAMLATDFLERIFAPQRMPGREPRAYREALVWMARMLKRPATLADLTSKQLTAVQKFIGACGFGAIRERNVKTHLSALAKHAWRLGFVKEWQPTKTRKRQRPRHRVVKSAPPGTLAAIFEHELRPKFLAQGRSANYIAKFVTAIARLDALLGRFATPGDITRERLQQFKDNFGQSKRSKGWMFQCQNALRQILRHVDPERYRELLPKALPAPAPGTVRAFFESDYRPLRLVGAHRSTIRDMRRTLRSLHQFAKRDLRVDELTDMLAADFFEWLLTVQKLETVSVNGHRARLFSIWRLAVERGLLARDPRVRKLRESVDAPDAWNEAEFQRLLQAPFQLEWQNDIAGIPAAQWWHALLLVAYWTGLRRRSLLELRRCDVDLASGWVNVPGNAIKNKCGKRVRLGTDALAALAAIWQPERELLFPYPNNETNFYRAVRRICDAAELRPSTRKTGTRLHKVRRTVATLTAVKRGIGAACELLGHSGTEMTKRYIDPSKLPGSDATEWLPTLSSSQPAPAVAKSLGPREWLEQAGKLHLLGFNLAAAMIGRVALERWLHGLAKSSNVQTARRDGINAYAVALHERRVINSATFQAIRASGKELNRAAHGKDLTNANAGELLAQLALILNSTVSVPSLSETA